MKRIEGKQDPNARGRLFQQVAQARARTRCHSHKNALSHMLPNSGLFTATTFECNKTQHAVLWGAIIGTVIAILQARARQQLLQLAVGCLRGRVIPTA